MEAKITSRLHHCFVILLVLSREAVCTGDIFYFSSWPESGRVAAGESRVMKCAVSDKTSITLSWHLDGKPISYTARRHLRGGMNDNSSSDLIITRAIPEDAGEYTCIAHNTTSGFALTSLPATLTVLWVSDSSKVVLGDPKELESVSSGSSITLRCKVEGGPQLYYSWRRNGDPVSGLRGVTVSRKRLTIDTFDANIHNGVYTCIATINKPAASYQDLAPVELITTTTSIPLILSVYDPQLPSVKVVPESLVVGPGRSAELHCSYETGTTVEWFFKDNGPLANSSRYTLKSNGTLVLLSADILDEGVYKCVGKHPHRAHRAAFAASVTLAYLDKSTPPTLEPSASVGSTHVVGLGGRLQVSCLPPPGLPHPQVTWVSSHLGDPEKASSIKVEGIMLIIEDASYDHEGNYTCIASNLGGNASVSMQLVVTRKPKVEISSFLMTVLEEETARLECKMDAQSQPYSNVSWTQNSHPVSIDDYRVSLSGMGAGVSQGVSVLRIRWARLEDAGLYACVVTTAGHPPVTSKSMKLVVTERLKFSPPPQDSRVELGGNISIPCEARGEVTPKITWHRVTPTEDVDATSDNVHINDGALEVYGAELQDGGQYVCIASSPQGSINASITLAVVEGPVLEWVTHSPVQIEKGGTLLLECHARGSPRPTIHWDYNHMPNAFDPERVEVYLNGTLQLSNVKLDDSGVFGCTAGNMGGLVRAEITVNVKGDGSQLLGRTVGVAVGGAGAYILLVGAMLIYCRQRRQRLKHSPAHTRAESGEDAQNAEEQERLMHNGHPGGSGTAVEVREAVAHGSVKPVVQADHLCQLQLSQVSPHTLGTSTQLGHSQASTRTIGGSSISTQQSSPLQHNSSPSAQSIVQAGPSEYYNTRQESTFMGLHQDDKSGLQRENIQVLLTLGRGEFGDVQLARLRNSAEEVSEDNPPDSDKLVMVKVISTRDDHLLAEVCREAAMFSGPTHPHVVSSLGMCTSHTPHLLVTQYTDWGDLKQFLLATRKESPRPLGSLRPPPLTYQQCLSLALQAAQGLEFLSGRRYTHRDIAARNCLITSTLQIKLASPALTRDAYSAEYCTYRNQVLPVRWLAPEALIEEEYSMKSSVFSWAWLAWELLTQADIPHSDLTDHQVISAAESGELHCSAPPRTPADLVNLLESCWRLSPKIRPSIITVVESLTAMT
ncbi:inactive tyrosine-protein kinase 7-like [Macrobrachium rosenbergii]|uniref:inactive tyrosine-protein kinase 7-like n=1 Tax=Macrobrachium rosenbergii TaxID=79674 RepID=UPI0034D640DC